MYEITKLEKAEALNTLLLEKWCETQEVVENIESIVKEWNETHQRDRHAAPAFLEDIETVLSQFIEKGDKDE